MGVDGSADGGIVWPGVGGGLGGYKFLGQSLQRRINITPGLVQKGGLVAGY